MIQGKYCARQHWELVQPKWQRVLAWGRSYGRWVDDDPRCTSDNDGTRGIDQSCLIRYTALRSPEDAKSGRGRHSSRTRRRGANVCLPSLHSPLELLLVDLDTPLQCSPNAKRSCERACGSGSGQSPELRNTRTLALVEASVLAWRSPGLSTTNCSPGVWACRSAAALLAAPALRRSILLPLHLLATNKRATPPVPTLPHPPSPPSCVCAPSSPSPASLSLQLLPAVLSQRLQLHPPISAGIDRPAGGHPRRSKPPPPAQPPHPLGKEHSHALWCAQSPASRAKTRS